MAPPTSTLPKNVQDLLDSMPRTSTPEPRTSSGHRSSVGGVELLEEDGAISEPLYLALCHIFSLFCTPSPAPSSLRPTPQGNLYPPPPPTSYLSPEGLDAFAKATNGSVFPDDTKEEIKEFFDLDEASGGLNMKGFEQMYTLQTENEEEETWKDLAAHGFDRQLHLVSSRNEDSIDESPPVPMEHLEGLGMGGTKKDEA